MTDRSASTSDSRKDVENPALPGRPAVSAAVRRLGLSGLLGTALRDLGRQHGADFHSVLAAAFGVLLYRHTGVGELCVGSPIAGRQGQADDAVLRLNLAGRPSFHELLGRVGDARRAAAAWQDVTSGRVIKAVLPESGPGPPLFQVMLDVRDAPVRAESEGFEVDVKYNPDLIDAVTVARLAGHFRSLLESIVANPGAEIDDLALLGASERHQAVVEWNDTAVGRVAGATLTDLLEAQAARTPDAEALVFDADNGPVRLSYRQLHAAADRLAWRLRGLGVGEVGAPETLVGILLERSPDLLVALFAVLKAGGSYVPLDPTYPRERLAYMVADSGTPVLLTVRRLATELGGVLGGSSASVFDLDGVELWSGAEPGPPPRFTAPESPAYTIYTSGSTGRPKGATNRHAAIVNRLLWMQETYRLGTGDRVMQKTPVSFDVSVWELFWPFLTGAGLVVARPEGHRDNAYLVDLVVREGVTTMHFVPPMLQLFLEQRDVGRAAPTLERVIASGEALPAEVERRFAQRLPGVSLHNLYGPTEAAIDVTYHRCTGSGERPVPIGRPIANTAIRVLDPDLGQQPIGVSGELHIGGVNLARGYHRRPALTAGKFIPSPFARVPGARLYKTGDLVRLAGDGRIDFQERIDHQVKLRGFRIELGEIAAVLERHPRVDQAVVLLRGETVEKRRLVAYLVTPDGRAPSRFDLLAFLRRQLPDYMVPGAFVILEHLPLTPNGKIDRRALPAPARTRPDLEQPLVEPSTPFEVELARLWEEILDIDGLGVHDRFWDLGGDSLAATRLAARIFEVSAVEVPLSAFFGHPTIARLAEWISAHQASAGVSLKPGQVPRSGPPPLSFSQERIWLVEQLDATSLAYHFPATLRFSGRFDAGVLRRALSEIIRRHEIYRTSIAIAGGRPVQEIHSPRPARMPVVDLSAVPAPARQREFRRQLAAEVRRRLDLSRPPLVRWVLFALSESEHVLSHVEHHTIHDGWSINVLLEELTELYRAFLAGRPSPLPELPIQFADFALWERQWMEGEAAAAQIAAWSERLAGCPTCIDLPLDRARPPVQTFRGKVWKLVLSAEQWAATRELGRRRDATFYMALTAVFGVLMHRLSGAPDICLGSPIANRRWLETEGLLGMFINNVVLRLDLGGRPTFLDLLARMREILRMATANQDAPYDRVVEAVRPERSPSFNPLFQVMFGLHDAPLRFADLDGLEIEVGIMAGNGSAKFDLNVVIAPRTALDLGYQGDGGCLFFEYNTDLFDTSTIGHLVRHFETLLESAVAEPERRISELPMLTAGERHQLTVDWNDSRREEPAMALLHALFERQAARTPERIAISLGARQLSYRALDRRSNRLARCLRRKGVGPDTLVALCMQRGLGMMVGFLGILKAGGAYVPLDPSNPRRRLELMLADSRPPIVLTDESSAPALPAVAEVAGEVVYLDREWHRIAGESGRPLAAEASPARADDTAYVIYTSGSTGHPKGVEVSHRNAVNFLTSMAREPGLSATDVLLAVTTVSFDISVLELFGPLAVGARGVIARASETADGDRLARLLAARRASVMQATPVTWQLLLGSGWSAGPGLKMLCGGEALPRVLAGELLAGGGELWNLYGPTETTVWSTATRVRDVAEPMTIGRPIDNTRVYVLDAGLRPVSRGAVGELFLGGTGIARGYRDRSRLTAAHFLPDPFPGAAPGHRLYRTGDRVRFDARGRLRFLGRVDHQIKLRGFRIEVGEIEAALERHPAVERAVVLLQGESAAERRLLACLLEPGDGTSAAELRGFLSEAVPDYMVPAGFVALPAFPMSASGKIDRQALARAVASGEIQAGELAAAEIESGEVAAPRGPVEEAVAGAFAEVLELREVDVGTGFFDLGGHSLLAIQLLSRIRDVFQLDLPLSTVFAHPTVRDLADQVAQARRGRDAGEIVPIRPVAREDGVPRRPGPLSAAQRRLWFLDRLGAGAAYNLRLGVALDGELEAGALVTSLRRIVERHEVLRATFPAAGGKPRQAVSSDVELPFQTVDLAAVDDGHRHDALRRLTRAVEAERFDLARGPLLRAVLVRWRPRRHLLVVIAHHIAFDGWSMVIFRHELAAHYQAALGRRPPLPELEIQYLDFAAWQQQRLRGPVLARELAYWQERLWANGNRLPVVQLPADRPRPPVPSFRGGSWFFRLPADRGRELAALSRRQGVTLAMLLLTAFKVLLARITGQRDLIVGSPVAQRLRSEVENLIGFFANSIVLRTDLSAAAGGPAFSECLRRVQQVTLAAYDHQEMPFDLLVDEIEPERNLSRNPIFQIVFAFQQMTSQTVELPGLRMRPRVLDSWFARTDLEFFLIDDPDGLSGRLGYNADLFDATTVGRIAGQFKNLLLSVLADPDADVGDLTMLGKSERHQLAAEWNDTERSFAELCLHQLIAARAAATPDKVAVIFDRLVGDSLLSYRELDARAARVARALRKLGIAADDRVALCLERGTEMIVALLGILKAGGAYVPLDPEYPRRRLAFMVGDCRARVLLTRETLLARLPEHGARVLCIDRDREWIAGGSEARDGSDRGSPATADNLAYVIYTSGSTGRPKGTQLAHRGLASLCDQQARAFGVGPDSRVLQFSSLSFDASTFEVAMALPRGATLVLGSRQALSPGPDLATFLARQRVSIVTLPPTALAPMPPAALPALETITVAGEACPAELPSRWAEGRRFFNLYGPTEATIWSTMMELRADRQAPSIGRPIANTEACLLASGQQLTPVGVAGELHLGGMPLARGYLERPALTAERFIPDTRAAGRPGSRLYRTGDLARYLRDGRIEFLGRIDHQVKLRGFRIELGEIEAALASHDAVRDVAVVAREDPAGEQQLVAYVVGTGDGPSLTKELRRDLSQRLPSHMIPAEFVTLESLPATPSGKLDHRALPAPVSERQVGEAYVAPRGEVEAEIAAIWGAVLGVEQVGVHDNFFDLGGHSLRLVQVQARLREELGYELSMIDLFQHPNVAAIAERLRGRVAPATVPASVAVRHPAGGQAQDGAIAVIAVAGRFPGARDPEELWSNVEAGVESIRFFTDDELRAVGTDEATLRDPSLVKARGVLDGVEQFDARLFGYTPREAELIDPQQRIFLECAWQALERAGYDPERYEGLIGVYAGASSNGYLANVRSRPEHFDGTELQAVLSSGKDYLPTRVSYKLNLRGPSLNVQTACSTSLVAVHTACRALLDRQCDVALAGGVSVSVPPVRGYFYRQGDIGSPDGHCRTFDARAQGTLRGDGAGIVVLKRLDDALADGDVVHATILGTAINNDGSDKVGFTAPAVAGQAEVIAMAQAAAGVDADTISYVEAHGTATPLGDPIEVAALTRAFGEHTGRRGFCGLSSLKSNVGHLDATAGVAGLIKAVMALEHRTLPPSLHFEDANPEIDFESSPFYVITERRDWQVEEGMPRRAGVSSFGLGGTNAHAVLEEAPAHLPSAPSHGWQLLVLSAQNPEALDTMAAELAAHLRAHREVNLADVAYTLQVGRRELEHRRAVRCRDVEEAIAALAGERPELACDHRATAGASPVAFMFPGQGAQEVGMGAELYARPGAYRQAVDACLAIIDGELGLGLRAVLYPDSLLSGEESERLSERLQRTSMAQPALFTVSYALARQWLAWGVEPDSMIGHSLGEVVAACLAGVLDLEDAVRLVVARGRLMAAMPAGAMTAVPLAAGEVETLLAGGGDLWLSVVNAASMCVVSGASERVAAFESRLADLGTECRRLHTSHAFHSGLMDGAIEPFVAQVSRVKLGTPSIPYVSNVTGDWIATAEVRDPGYWGRQIRHPVRFAGGMERILADPGRVLLEVGPGIALCGLSKLQEGFGRERVAVSSLGRAGAAEAADSALAGALGRLWAGGVAVDWARIHGDARRRRVTLPTYPFQRQRYWIDRAPSAAAEPASSRRRDLADWFYVPVWRRATGSSGLVPATRDPASGILVIGSDSTFGQQVVERLQRSGRRVLTADAGPSFDQTAGRFTIDPRAAGDYVRLLAALERAGGLPGEVVHLWGVSFDPRRPSEARAAGIQERGLSSLLHLARALAEAESTTPVRISVVTDGVHQILGDEAICPEKATVLGACRVMPLELPGIDCRNVDLTAEPGGESDQVARLVDEILKPGDEPIVAFRRGRRWIQALTPMRLDAVAGSRPRRLRQRGVYLLTGGLGGMGLEVAAELARALEARLVLTGRTGLPERSEWPRALAREAVDDRIRQAIRAIEAMEAVGAEVLVARADVRDRRAMRAVVAAAEERFGTIHGVFHLAVDYAPGIIQSTGPAEVERELAAKVTGARVLERELGDRELDFMVLASSLVAWSGQPGRVAYCAANAYLDAFARRFGADTGSFAVAVDWTTWRDAGLALRTATARGREIRGGITSGEGIEALRRLLDGCDEPQVLVCEVDPRDLAEPSSPGADVSESAPAVAEAVAKHRRPELSTDYDVPRTEAEKRLAAIWQDLFGIERIGIRDNFFELGGDSVLGIRIVAAARAAGIAFTVRELLEQETIEALAVASTATVADAEQGMVVGPLPLTPVQRWFFEQDLAQPHHFNQAVLLELPAPVEPELLAAALDAIVRHHDALRLRFAEVDGEWQAAIAPAGDQVALEVVDLEGMGAAEVAAVIDRHGARIQASLDLAGPIVRAALFRAGSGASREPDRLLVVVHHLAVDALSWQILLEDLARGLRPRGAGRGAALPPKTTSIRAWAEYLASMAGSANVAVAARAWCEMPWATVRALPRDFPAGDNTVASIARESASLSAEQTRALLGEATARLDARVDDLLLVALAQAVGTWTGALGIAIDVEGLGREVADEAIDVSRTVGWFTAIHQVLVEVEPAADLPALLARSRERLAWCREHQLSYGLARYLSPDAAPAEALRSLPPAEISFVYFGQADMARPNAGAVKRSHLSVGSARGSRARRRHLLEIDVAVLDGCLRARCVFSRNIHDKETISRLIEAFRVNLERLARDESKPAPRPVDAERFGWSEQDLAGVLGEIERLRE